MEQSQTEIDDKLPVIVCQQQDTNAGAFINFQYVLVFIESKCIYKVRLFIVPQHPAPVAINNCYCQLKHHIYFFHKKNKWQCYWFHFFSIHILQKKKLKNWTKPYKFCNYLQRPAEQRPCLLELRCRTAASPLPHRHTGSDMISTPHHSLAGWSIFFTPCSTAYLSLPFI